MFEATIEKIVEAAKAADLADYRWAFWNDVYTYTLIYAYAVHGHETYFGVAGRAVFVTLIDDLGAYYGPKSIETTIEAKDAGERWEALLGRLAGVVDRHSHENMEFRPNMTYWPEEQQQATQ